MVQRQLRLTTAAAPLPPTDLALAAAAEPQEKVKATRKGSVWVGEEEGQPSEEAGLPLELGWTEGFGIYRGSTVAAELRAWETDPAIMAFQHLPTRALVTVNTNVRPPDAGRFDSELVVSTVTQAANAFRRASHHPSPRA